MRKLLAFVEVHSETPVEKDRYEQWKVANSDVVAYRPTEQLGLSFDGAEEAGETDLEEDVVPQELLENVTELSRHEYDVAAILKEVFSISTRSPGSCSSHRSSDRPRTTN